MACVFIDRLGFVELQNRSLASPAYSSGDVDMRVQKRSPGQHERLKWGKGGVQFVDPSLQAINLCRRRRGNRRILGTRGARELGADIEELILNNGEFVPQRFKGSLRTQCDTEADVAVEFVDVTVRGNADGVLLDSGSSHEPRGAIVSRPRVNSVERYHCVSPKRGAPKEERQKSPCSRDIS